MEPRRNRVVRRRRMGGAMCAFLLLASAGCNASPPASLPEPPPPAAYLIGPDDTLEVVVWREDTLSGTVRVRSDGMITVPLLGGVAAAGQTPEALAETIRQGLSRFVESPNVVVRVAATGSRRFFVIGNVRTPGAYDLRTGQTFVQALAVAGGFTDFADRDGVRIIRGGAAATPLNLDYDAIVRGESADIRLEPNDTIVVP